MYFRCGCLLANIITLNNLRKCCECAGVCALSVGFTGKTGFTFKLLHGEKMSETVSHIELNRYVVQVIVINIHLIALIYIYILAYQYTTTLVAVLLVYLDLQWSDRSHGRDTLEIAIVIVLLWLSP